MEQWANYRDRDVFLQLISDVCQKNPSWASFVSEAASVGVMRANSELKQLAADMETVASVMLAMKLDGHAKRLCFELLERNKPNCSINFQFYIDRLKPKDEPDADSTPTN